MRQIKSTPNGTEYTAGPWRHDDVWHLIYGRDESEVCALHAGTAGEQRNHRNVVAANAKLITSAPTMLNLLNDGAFQLARLTGPDLETYARTFAALAREQVNKST